MKKDKDKEKIQTPPEADAPDTEQKPDAQPAEEPVCEEPTVDQWREALELAVKQRDDYLDSLRRTQADFQNFKRRNQTARADGYMDASCDVIEAMLPVIDNLERALDAAQEEDPLAEGVKMTLKMLFDSLKRFGFEEVPALGE